MKFISVILVLMIIIFGLVVTAQPGTKMACTEFGHLNSLMMNSNKIELDPELMKHVSIEWIHPNSLERIEIYRNGQELTKIPNKYGLNTIKVSVNGKEQISKQHIKENWWHSHIYQVKGSTDNIVVQIKGCNGA